MVLNWIIGIVAIVIVGFTVKHIISNIKNGKEDGCSGCCSSCSGCGIHHPIKPSDK